MKLRTKLKLFTAAVVLSGGMAHAAVTIEQVINEYRQEGYTWIEIKRGPTQIKVEAVKGDTKVETIYDIETGQVLKTESERADPEDVGREGVERRDVNRDFVRVVRGDDDGTSDDSPDLDDDDDDDDRNDDHGDHGPDHDDDDDDDDDDHGGDDHGDDGSDHDDDDDDDSQDD